MDASTSEQAEKITSNWEKWLEWVGVFLFVGSLVTNFLGMLLRVLD